MFQLYHCFPSKSTLLFDSLPDKGQSHSPFQHALAQTIIVTVVFRVVLEQSRELATPGNERVAGTSVTADGAAQTGESLPQAAPHPRTPARSPLQVGFTKFIFLKSIVTII